MNTGDLTPWLSLAVVLVPLLYAEKWVHRHLYGIGWLLTENAWSATVLYYVLLFPGVFLHEFVQWLVSGALRIPTKKVSIWPEPQKDGTLRLDFVQLDKSGPVGAAIIGAAPMVVGIVTVWAISNYILNLDELLAAFHAGDITAISRALRQLGSTPDFYLWLYVIFAVSNAMWPTPADRQGWPLLIGVLGAVLVFLVAIGTGEALLRTYRESVVPTLEHLTTVVGMVWLVELPAMLTIGIGEGLLERATKRRFVYREPPKPRKRAPGSPEPLPPGTPKPSIYRMELPVPDPPTHGARRVARSVDKT